MSIVSSPTLMNGKCLGQQHDITTPVINKRERDSQDFVQTQMPHSAGKTDNQSFSNSDISLDSKNTEENESHEDHAAEMESPTIDIIINNVVCTFSTRCYLNLKKIATEGIHVEYKRENGMLNMKLRRPNSTATIWSSGKITCTGSTSEDDAKIAARRTARRLQKLGFSIRFTSYRVVNVLGTCSLPFGIKLNQFSEAHRTNASYEPELHPGVTYRIKDPKATLKIFSTGSITVTAPSVVNVQLAIEHIYPLVIQHKMETIHVRQKDKHLRGRRPFPGYPVLGCTGDGGDDNDLMEDLSDDSDSDVS